MTVDLTTPLPAIRVDGRIRSPMLMNGGTLNAEMTLAHLIQVLAALTDEQRREVIGQALGITGFGGFECDPRVGCTCI